MASDPVKAYGWTALPLDVKVLLESRTQQQTPEPVLVSSVPLPDTPLVKAVHKYAKQELAPETFNHSLRVYYYGIAIAKYSFPAWLSATPSSFEETYFLTCLLHDIGTTDTNMADTLLSFEFYGGMIALELLLKEGSPRPQAESVSEAVIRHQDLGTVGTITTIGALVQLATIFDNMGGNSELVHKGTIEDVVKNYPRLKWSSCFSKTIRKENTLKPWAHTTALGVEDFPNGVANNKLMETYE